MFEKLLSLAPYNPGLVHQLAFYGRRMREEAGIRRIGLVFLLLTFFVQFFAVISPPQPTVASSDNDLIVGGFNAASEARQDCVNNIRGYQNILHNYGIHCDAISDSGAVVIHGDAQGNQYFSMGHNPSSCGDTPVEIPGIRTVYFRHLSCWPEPAGGWQAIRVRNEQGRVFYILKDCGNLVSIGLPPPTPIQIVVEGPPIESVPPPQPVTPPAPTPPTPAPTPPPSPQPTPPQPAPQPQPCQYNSSLPANSALCFKPCQFNDNLPADSSECKPCDKSVSPSDTLACIQVRKTASNVTAGVADANNTTAKAGDVITYTLFADNKGKENVKKYAFQENLSDVMDYADVVDLHGGNIDNDKIVSWPAEAIKSESTASHQITVKVKDPIPQTPTSSSDPMHFDLTMTNVYGNTINIKLPGSPAKTVETTAATLPNTGPGTTLFIAAAIVVIAGYFYARSNLLAIETNLAVKETSA